MTFLLLTVHWLDDRYHGLLSRDGPPEWPPSPFRLFQALVSGVAQRGELDSATGESLRWLQKLDPPTIVAPRTCSGQVVTRFVPNNDGDKKPDRQDRLKGKTFRPTLILDRPEIHYLWPFDSDEVSQAQLVCQAARYLTCLGWGIDVAYSEGRLVGSEKVAELSGIRWHPRKGIKQDSGLLRVPVFDNETKANTLDDLKRAYQSALNRVEHDKPLNSVEKPKIFERVYYESNQKLLVRQFAAFSIRKLDDSGLRAFDAARQSRTVAGMVRGVASSVAKDAGWSDEKIGAFILGHGETRTEPGHKPVGPRRFAFLPLPSIEPRGTGKPAVVSSIRRVLVTTFADDCRGEVDWARRALANQALIEEKTRQEIALLAPLADSDRVLRHYTQESCEWATVTPVVLPGFDDPDHLRRRSNDKKPSPELQRRILERLASRVDGLLRKAIQQAGFAGELADNAALDWRSVGFLPGTELAGRYGVPDYLKRFPRLHVRINWRNARGESVQVPGPICIGGGRYFGLGLFAAVSE